jgi:hypothetical protein
MINVFKVGAVHMFYCGCCLWVAATPEQFLLQPPQPTVIHVKFLLLIFVLSDTDVRNFSKHKLLNTLTVRCDFPI